MRLYRTFAGLRAIVTHDVMDPQSTAALDVLKQLGSDPLYIKLCKAQEVLPCSTDAKALAVRLHPEPAAASDTDKKLLVWYERWKEDYESRQAQFATCRLLSPVGNPFMHPEALRSSSCTISPQGQGSPCCWRERGIHEISNLKFQVLDSRFEI